MFPITPVQSWTFLILLAVLAVLVVHLLRRLGSKTLDVLEDRITPEQDEESTPPLAEERTLRPHDGRHLRPLQSRQDPEDDNNPLAIWKDVLNS